MALVKCEVSAGLRESEVTVAVKGIGGDVLFLRVEADFLVKAPDGSQFLTVGVVSRDPKEGHLLIELPQEADSGESRLWVAAADVKKTNNIEMFV